MKGIIIFLGICYFLASEASMFVYVVPEQVRGYDAEETKMVIKAILLIPVAVVIGPYFIYKVLKGE